MPNRRRCIVRSLPAAAAALLLWGCAGPLAGIPRFPWGKPVDLRGVRFEFESVRSASSIAGSPLRPTAEAGRFVIVKVAMTNRTDAPIGARLWPVFRLLDPRQAMYAPSAMRIAAGGLQLPADAAPSPPSMEPGATVQQEIVFDVPVQDYVLLVIMQSGRALYGPGTVTPLNSYFILDIASQLARPGRDASPTALPTCEATMPGPYGRTPMTAVTGALRDRPAAKRLLRHPGKHQQIF